MKLGSQGRLSDTGKDWFILTKGGYYVKIS